MSALDIRAIEGGCILRLRVTAGAARAGCAGEHDGALKVRVRAAPERGKANRAVLALLAELLGVPAARLRIVRGETSRDKHLRVDGEDVVALRSRLERILSTRGPSR